jgi:uncharacterized phage infection (PIP) family protein YhgE
MPHNRGNSGNKDKQKQTSEVLNESRETLYGTDRPNDPLSNSMFFQFMTRLDDRLKTIETNVTKSVGELDDIKKTVRSISGTVTTVQNEVKELSKKYVDLETHTQGMSNIFDNVRSECSDNSKAIKELAYLYHKEFLYFHLILQTFVSVCPCFHYSPYCVAFLRRLV